MYRKKCHIFLYRQILDTLLQISDNNWQNHAFTYNQYKLKEILAGYFISNHLLTVQLQKH